MEEGGPKRSRLSSYYSNRITPKTYSCSRVATIQSSVKCHVKTRLSQELLSSGSSIANEARLHLYTCAVCHLRDVSSATGNDKTYPTHGIHFNFKSISHNLNIFGNSLAIYSEARRPTCQKLPRATSFLLQT